VDGRKVEFVRLDDAYEPPRAVQNARRLIQQEKVFAIFNTLGTPPNLAIWDYVNEQKVPHVFLATGASDWGADIGKHPYTIGWQPDYVTEAQVYAD
jgi:branched-chain amino acid transport system substrate-binding protein